jgi:hypothetical protein
MDRSSGCKVVLLASRSDCCVEQSKCLGSLALGHLVGGSLDDCEDNSVVDLDPACVLVMSKEGGAA